MSSVSPDLEALFRALRSACSAHAWSRGVELSRAGNATVDPGSDDEEIAMSVRIPGQPVARRVTLYVPDHEWECDCQTASAACEHAAAAAIAYRSALKQGKPAPTATRASGRLRYELTREAEGLGFARSVVTGDEVVPLGQATLEAIARGRVDGPPAAATPVDLEVEVSLGAQRVGVFPEARWRKLLALLARCDDVRLDGEPVQTDAAPLRPRVRLDDVAEGFRLRLLPPAGVRELLPGGLALCEDSTIRSFGASGLDGRELEDFRRGRIVPFDSAAELVTEVLPSLERRIEVERRSSALPETTERARPQVRVEVERRDDALSLLPLLVYGDPPIARVDGDQLVALPGEDGARPPVPIRDREAERDERHRLAQALGVTPGRRVDFQGAEAIGIARKLQASRLTIAGDAHRAFRERGRLEARVETGDSETQAGFELWFETEAEGGRADAPAARISGEAVVGAWQRGESWVALGGDQGFAPLPSDWLERFGPAIADLLAARDADGHVRPASLPELGRLCDALGMPRPPSVERLHDALAPLLDSKGGDEPLHGVPGGLSERLRNYQREGVDWLRCLTAAGLGALLADDMGLGKTLQTLCSLPGRTLVVAPTSVLVAWRAECERFRPDLRVHVYHGPGRSLDPDADITLTSYALLRNDADLLCDVRWEAVVLDEAQAIKNADSQVARAAHRLDATARIALTGTPVENRLDELWSQFQFLNPGWLGSRSDFQARYAGPIAQGDDAVSEHLRSRIRPFVMRRLKEEVATELPPRSDVLVGCELDADERRLYDAVAATTRREVAEKLAAGGSVIGALEALLRLRQAACHSGLLPGQARLDSTKVDELVARLEITTGEGHAALVFSQWTALLDRIEPALREAGIEFARLDGSTRDRSVPIEALQSGAVPVLLVSLKAGGAGLTLTAADHVFLMDPWWNPAVEEQAAARAHRIGQTRPVIVHRMISTGTVEERILAMHEHKRELFERAMSGAGSGLTRDDLLALLD